MLYIGRWLWKAASATEPFAHWSPPENCVGSIDLRSNVQAAQTVTPAGFGLFDIDGPAPAGCQVFGADMEDSPSNTIKDRIATALGLTKVPAWVRCGDIVREILTLRCDPTGQTRCKGLMPGRDRRLHLHLGRWHASRPFAPGEVEEWPKIQQALRLQYREARRASLAGETPAILYRKILGYWCRKFRTQNWQQFIPLDLPMEEPVEPTTTITESFNTADSATLGPDLTWTELESNDGFGVVSNAAEVASSTGHNTARADSDLSSVDHYAQVVLINDPAENDANRGVIARKDSTATLTYYHFDIQGLTPDTDIWRMFKRVAGSFTALGTNTTSDVVVNDVLKGECDGSTITRYRNGSSQTSVTDTAITTGTRCGIYAGFNGSGARIDSFEAADLAAAVIGRLVGGSLINGGILTGGRLA